MDEITQITVHCNFSSWSGTGQLFHHVNDLLTSARKHEHNSVHSSTSTFHTQTNYL